MLAVEAQAVSHEAYANTLALQEREMQVILQHLSNLGNQGALIAGFVFVIFTGEITFDDTHDVLAVLAMTFSMACFGAMVYVIICSTISCGLGPIMGLKGKDPSAMRVAVQHMRGDRRMIARAFNFGVVCFALLSIVLLWNKLYHQVYNAIIQTVIMMFFLVSLSVSARAMTKRYEITEEDYTQGTPQKVRAKDYLNTVKRVQKAEGDANDPATQSAISRGI